MDCNLLPIGVKPHLVMANHHELASFIGQIADLLRGACWPRQSECVMLAMTVVRRFDCVLLPQRKGNWPCSRSALPPSSVPRSEESFLFWERRGDLSLKRCTLPRFN